MKIVRQKQKRYFKIFLIIILILGAMIFTNYSLKKERNLTFIEKAFKDGTTFICNVLYAPVEFIKDKVEIYREKENIYEKYLELKKEADDNHQNQARIKELEKENKELIDMLELNSSLSEYDAINATIISRDVGYWYNKLVIDKGTNAGVEPRMAVVISSGLVGYISETSNFSSNVQLLNVPSLKNKISVKIALDNDSYATGLLNGYDEKNGVYTIEGISFGGDIPLGAYVTTTGFSDSFPSGILVGYVSKITTDNFDLGKIVEVKPAVDFSNIEFITVLKRKASNK